MWVCWHEWNKLSETRITHKLHVKFHTINESTLILRNGTYLGKLSMGSFGVRLINDKRVFELRQNVEALSNNAGMVTAARFMADPPWWVSGLSHSSRNQPANQPAAFLVVLIRSISLLKLRSASEYLLGTL